MNEVEKKTVAEVANRLALMAEELRSGKFMSVADVANVIDCRVRHLRNALDYAATAAQPAAATPTTDEPGKMTGGLVGIKSNKTHILAWNYSDGLDIRVTGDQTSPDVWQVRVECGNSMRLLGSVFGGRWQTDRLIRALRNGMTSRRLRLKKIRSNKEKEGK